MKKEIQVFDYAKEIMEALREGVILTTKANNKVNLMTISWGNLGINWGKTTFTVYVRDKRFTKEQIEENPQFTINIPIGEIDKQIVAVCGNESGEYHDKAKELNLTLVDGNEVTVPGIKELPITLECKVIYKQMQDLKEVPKDIVENYYPESVETLYCGEDQECHIAYIGEVVNAYIIE